MIVFWLMAGACKRTVLCVSQLGISWQDNPKLAEAGACTNQMVHTHSRSFPFPLQRAFQQK